MKIRNGFISNSSSSSFVCPICGETTSDIFYNEIELGKYGFVKSECEHVFCKEHLIEVTDEEYKVYAIEMLSELLEDFRIENCCLEHSLELSINSIKDGASRTDIEEIMDKFFDSKYLDIQCPICTK